ncbi:MAG: FKBP-type peptidyl-prolyl cis-trans isomerase [Pseudobacteriovorax sp.]|nr:FKBP-type peptidyl-prolyl cis-trans isomerase [Pseudobacteriovorax sp.]
MKAFSKVSPWLTRITISFLLGISLMSCDQVEVHPDFKMEDMASGSGPEVGRFDAVHVYYEGRLQKSNQVFDTNKNEPKPRRYSMRSSTLIDGWKVGLIGMKAGGKRRLIIPPEMAFGPGGKGQRIPPGATLIFDIELVKID